MMMDKRDNNLTIVVLNNGRKIIFNGEVLYNDKYLMLLPENHMLAGKINKELKYHVEEIDYLEMNEYVVINKCLENDQNHIKVMECIKKM